MRKSSSIALILLLLLAGANGAQAADDLKLRAGISFTQDIDSGFPIVAKDIDDCEIPANKPVFMFFGASGDLNTNRQAKRIVDLYKKVSSKPLKFILLDVDHPANEEARKLIKTYYKGYIPDQVILDKNGKQVWSQIGEVELGVLRSQLDKILD